MPRALAERCGYATALRLMEEFGGMQISIPTTPAALERSGLARALGEDAAKALFELCAGDTVEVPKGRGVKADARRRAILEHPGSNNEAARDLRLSRRWVRTVRADARKARRARLAEAFSRDGDKRSTPDNQPEVHR